MLMAGVSRMCSQMPPNAADCHRLRNNRHRLRNICGTGRTVSAQVSSNARAPARNRGSASVVAAAVTGRVPRPSVRTSDHLVRRGNGRTPSDEGHGGALGTLALVCLTPRTRGAQCWPAGLAWWRYARLLRRNRSSAFVTCGAARGQALTCARAVALVVAGHVRPSTAHRRPQRIP